MLDQEAIDQQQELLAAHRRTLRHWLRQAAQYGGVVSAPPQTANGIDEGLFHAMIVKTTPIIELVAQLGDLIQRRDA